ncbi:hypothetical protein MIND_01043900 [Mycena indigotica]|uniref:Uncharacterized protein n=1 Tax=Mycena indigotica TaxID=2126181 RepID=A0A8H6S9W7_9AGAR|nr:uncharacterized protein MIND_01043900 [Mycena indigotica]KAF7295057.1 hypothetical protein MIND_01043900 [Mycena indigotica]
MSHFNIFFTGREEALNCIMIGEDSSPRFYCFESQATRTVLYSNNNYKVASLQFIQGDQLGSATIGSRVYPMRELLSAGSSSSARCFYSSDGRKYEWRRIPNVSDAYDLYALNPPVVRVAAFRKHCEITSIGQCNGLLQYTFNGDQLLVYTLLTLALNRWVDNSA